MARVFIAGAGRVGLSLAHALPPAGHEVIAVWSRSAPSGASPRVSGELAGAPRLSDAEVVLVCVSDAAVPEIGRALAGAPLAPGCVVAHTSGALPAAALGAGPFLRGSLHPLCALPDPPRAAEILRGAVFAVEGDPEALPLLETVATSLGGRPVRLPADQKTRYHAAAVLASNLVVALLDMATAEAKAAGLPDATEALATLAIGALERVRERGIAAALTGPVVRGDAATIAAHLTALSPEAAPVYRALSERAVIIARRAGLPEASAAELMRRLVGTPSG